MKGSVEHGGCFVVLPRPSEGAGWRLTASGLVPFERGRQHKNQPQRHHPTSQQPTRIACRPFGGRARSQPAETIQTPLTRPHVPAFPTPPWQPHPASPQTSGQMEHGRRRSNTAGRETKGTDREENHQILHQHRHEKGTDREDHHQILHQHRQEKGTDREDYHQILHQHRQEKGTDREDYHQSSINTFENPSRPSTATSYQTHNIPTPPHAQHSPHNQAYGQAPEGYIRRHKSRYQLVCLTARAQGESDA